VGGIGNTLVTDNSADQYTNVIMVPVDLGWNYIGDDDIWFVCNPSPSSTHIGTVPAPLHAQLGPLAQNGSGMPTHATH